MLTHPGLSKPFSSLFQSLEQQPHWRRLAPQTRHLTLPYRFWNSCSASHSFYKHSKGALPCSGLCGTLVQSPSIHDAKQHFFLSCIAKGVASESGEMAQQSSTLVILTGDPQLTPIPNSSFRGSGTHFWPLQSPGTHTVYKQTCRQKTYTHKIKTNKFFCL